MASPGGEGAGGRPSWVVSCYPARSPANAARERWAADLVTLSACESGRGQVAPGEGVLGLVRAVLLTGVARVVTSQWVVDDRATRRLMYLYHEGLLGRGHAPARALAEAKRALIREGGAAAAPANWAAFVLWGLPE